MTAGEIDDVPDKSVTNRKFVRQANAREELCSDLSSFSSRITATGARLAAREGHDAGWADAEPELTAAEESENG